MDTDRDLYVWLNVPYAKPPVGELRWKKPVPAEAWEGVLDATQESNVAPQSAWWLGDIGTEDCLNLEIYRPANDKKDLPVIMFLHGGNNLTGYAAQVNNPVFANSVECVIVSLNFRLGLLGYNPLPAVKTGDPLEDSGNYGFLDIALAMDWIQENIAAFGGDPNNVTITGSSAGGRDVMAMLISPLFEGKFHKAISYSGGMTVADSDASAKVMASRLAPLAVEDGKAADEKAAYHWLLTDGQDVRDYLYGLSEMRLAGLFPDASIRMAHFPHLYADGVTLPVEGFATENYIDVPIIMFTGTNEFSMFATSNYFGTLDKNAADYQPQVDFVNKYGGMLYELFNAEESAAIMSHAYDAPIYLLTVNGAGHSAQGNVLAPGSRNKPQEFEISEVYLKYLYNFLRTGDPNAEGLPVWTAWTEDVTQPNTMMLDPISGDHGTAEMVNRRFVYADILAEMDADTTITPEQKQAIISQSLNGRWFSAQLDEYYQTPDLWDVEPE